MSLKNVDISNVMRRLADQRIEDAMQEGKFDNLPGAGKPLELDPAPADEAARMTWWALRILKHNDVTPDEVRHRKAIDFLKARLATAADEAQLLATVRQINDLVRKVNTLGTNALKTDVAPVDEGDALARFRAR